MFISKVIQDFYSKCWSEYEYQQSSSILKTLEKTDEQAIDSKKSEKNLGFGKKRSLASYFETVHRFPPEIKVKWADKGNRLSYIDNFDSAQKDSLKLFNSNNAKTLMLERNRKKFDASFDKTSYLAEYYSSEFYSKKTEEIQTSLSEVSVFCIVNGYDQIILNKPKLSKISQKLSLEGKIDLNLENYRSPKGKNRENSSPEDFQKALKTKPKNLGLFFVSKKDAERYLELVAKDDFTGTKTMGLSVQSIGLDLAYKIARENHSTIRFRIVPDFNEVKSLTKNIGKSKFIIDRKQKQAGFKIRHDNIFPYFSKLGRIVSPKVTAYPIHKDFLGVPIYIVQVTDRPSSLLVEPVFKIANWIDTTYNRWFKYTIGQGGKIMQGSMQNLRGSNKVTNFIFFEQGQAKKFVKKTGRKVVRFKKGNTTIFSLIARKPKIFVYNLEYFLQDWEDHILLSNGKNNIFNAKSTRFMLPSNTEKTLETFAKEAKKGSDSNLFDALKIKRNVLQNIIEVALSIN